MGFSQLFNRLTDWLVTQTWLSVVVLLAVTLIAVGGYLDLGVWDFDEPRMVQTEDDQAFATVSAPIPSVRTLDLDADAILVCESDQFFTPAGARSMRHLVSELEALTYVRSVQWMDRVPGINLFGLPEPIYPRSSSSLEKFSAARDKALRHPLVKGLFLSGDARTLLLLINYDFRYVASDEQCVEAIRELADQAVQEVDGPPIAFSLTGPLPMVVTTVRSHEANQIKYQLIGYGMILVMSVILFRGISSVIIVALAPCLGVFWTLGLIRYFNFQDSPFNDVVLPIMTSLVGFTDGVHLLVQIRNNRASGMAPGAAARLGIQQVGLACMLTSLTTAIGFGSLALAHHEIVREFGLACVLGVVVTFWAVILLIPLACRSPLGKWLHVGHGQGIVDKNLARISGLIELVLRHKRILAIAALVVTVILTGFSLALRPDERRSNALPESSEAAVAFRKLDQAIGGLESAFIQVRWSNRLAADIPEPLIVLRELHEVLEHEPLAGNPLSIINFLDALPGTGTEQERQSMLALLPPPLTRTFLVPETRNAEVRFRCQDLGIATYGPVFQRIEHQLNELQKRYPEFRFELTGDAVWRWKNLYQIVIDLVASLGTAAIIIFFVLGLAYRSLRLGLIAVIPNIFPLALAGTYLYFTRQPLELVNVCAFTVCLGIAVDDTIHFLTRYLEERRTHGGDTEANIRRAFTSVGSALIMTTIVLVSGFMTVAFSDSRDHRIFSSMGAITIGAALFGDLVFLPAILAVAEKRDRPLSAKEIHDRVH